MSFSNPTKKPRLAFPGFIKSITLAQHCQMEPRMHITYVYVMDLRFDVAEPVEQNPGCLNARQRRERKGGHSRQVAE